jgi:hypothetical protein
MTRAGKEPAEDVKRAFRRAIEMVGLKAHRVEMFKTERSSGRIVMDSANPEGWPHECPAISMSTLVNFSGEVGRVDIRCAATDEEHLLNALSARTVRACSCELDDLPATLKAVWAERQLIIAMGKQGKLTSAFVGRWTWESPDPSI